jgi:hypothetical protein
MRSGVNYSSSIVKHVHLKAICDLLERRFVKGLGVAHLGNETRSMNEMEYKI